MIGKWILIFGVLLVVVGAVVRLSFLLPAAVVACPSVLD